MGTTALVQAVGIITTIILGFVTFAQSLNLSLSLLSQALIVGSIITGFMTVLARVVVLWFPRKYPFIFHEEDCKKVYGEEDLCITYGKFL